MRYRTSHAAALVLVAALLKQLAWVFWLPPGAFSRENDQYQMVARSGRERDLGNSRLLSKEGVELAQSVTWENGHLTAKTPRDLQMLRTALSRVDPGAFFDADHSVPQGSAYHSVMGRMRSWLVGWDIRWRWIALRLSSVFFLVAAGFLTGEGLRVSQRAAGVLAVMGLLLVTFGPASGFGGALIGPSAFLAALWAGWVLSMARTVLNHCGWHATWAALIALAISSISTDGLAASAATLAVAAGIRSRPAGRSDRAGRAVGIVLCILGLGVWVFRIVILGVGTPAALSGSEWVFSAPRELSMSALLAIGWGIIGVIAVVGLIKRAVTRDESAMILPLGAALLMTAAVSLLMPTAGITALSIMPVVGFLAVLGISALPGQRWAAGTLIVAIAVLDSAALMYWVLPRLYLWF